MALVISWGWETACISKLECSLFFVFLGLGFWDLFFCVLLGFGFWFFWGFRLFKLGFGALGCFERCSEVFFAGGTLDLNSPGLRDLPVNPLKFKLLAKDLSTAKKKSRNVSGCLFTVAVQLFLLAQISTIYSSTKTKALTCLLSTFFQKPQFFWAKKPHLPFGSQSLPASLCLALPLGLERKAVWNAYYPIWGWSGMVSRELGAPRSGARSFGFWGFGFLVWVFMVFGFWSLVFGFVVFGCFWFWFLVWVFGLGVYGLWFLDVFGFGLCVSGFCCFCWGGRERRAEGSVCFFLWGGKWDVGEEARRVVSFGLRLVWDLVVGWEIDLAFQMCCWICFFVCRFKTTWSSCGDLAVVEMRWVVDEPYDWSAFSQGRVLQNSLRLPAGLVLRHLFHGEVKAVPKPRQMIQEERLEDPRGLAFLSFSPNEVWDF